MGRGQCIEPMQLPQMYQSVMELLAAGGEEIVPSVANGRPAIFVSMRAAMGLGIDLRSARQSGRAMFMTPYGLQFISYQEAANLPPTIYEVVGVQQIQICGQ